MIRYNRRDERRNDDYNNCNDRRNDGYNNRNNSYARQEIEKGYQDGLNRGREDAQTNRQRTPNNLSHYHKGNDYHRQGFERGFYEAYNQYSNNGRGRR